MRCFYCLILFSLSFPVLCFAQNTEGNQSLSGVWHHLVEEQNDNELLFRLDGYPLPPSRGREKIEFFADGKFVFYRIAPSDGYIPKRGVYQLHDNNKQLTLKFKESQNEEIYKVLELSSDILRLRRN